MSIGRRLKLGGLILFSAVFLSACAGNVSAEDLQGLGLSPEEIETILSGVVEGLEDGKLMIDGNIVEISDETEFEGEIKIGDDVEIKFRFDDEGGMIAQSVEFSGVDDDDSEVEFLGIVESMGSDAWVIGGKNVAVTPSTEIKGGIAEGDSVKVHAYTDDAGALVAREIEPTEGDLDDDDSDVDDDKGEDETEIVGVVESIEDGVWTIDGKAFVTLPGTEIEDSLSVGDLVEVHFSIDEDGSLVAREIEAADNDLDDDSDLDNVDDLDDDNDDDEHDGDDDDDEDDEHEDDEDHKDDEDDDDDDEDDDNS